ncbi:MAG: hypothetical protein FJW34_08795 [Acidobacteria bacterium]|nr:hypothetical protein [Acidobacteriota bacterium]
MSCRRFEKDVALWVEGDLPPRQARRLEAHLPACPDCQQLVEGLRASQAALKELHAEAVEEDLAAVRLRVLARIRTERPQRRGWAWAYALGASLAVAAAVWVLLPRPSAPPLPPPRMLKPAPVEVARPAPPAAARPRPTRAKPPAAPEPLLVKLYTDDPDVIIYWLIEKTGGE